MPTEISLVYNDLWHVQQLKNPLSVWPVFDGAVSLVSPVVAAFFSGTC